MSQAREIVLDPLFTPAFFEFTEEAIDVKVEFPLPSSPTDLTSFLKYKLNLEEGGPVDIQDEEMERSKHFKEGFIKVINDIAVWCEVNQISADACEAFKNEYMEYSGGNEEMNVTNFGVYTQGIAWLCGIAIQLNNEKIQLDDRKSVIENLLPEFAVCGPGAVTKILDAYLDLIAFSNKSIYWMKLRRTLAEQILQEILNGSSVDEAMHIHYENGVINRFADELGVQMVEDENVDCCNPSKLDKLFAKFKSRIVRRLTLSNLIDQVMEPLRLESLKSKLEKAEPAVYAANVKVIERYIKRFGQEEHGKQFYSDIRDGIQLYGEYEDQIAVAWYAPYRFHLTIYSRMVRAGLIDVVASEDEIIIDERAKLFFLREHSMLFAYVQEENSGQVKTTPLVEYCIEKIVKKESLQIDALMVGISSKKTIKSNYMQLIFGLACYMNSPLRVNTQIDVAHIVNEHLVRWVRKQEDTEEVLNDLLMKFPVDVRFLLIKAFEDVILNGIVDNDQLVFILKQLPVAERPLLVGKVNMTEALKKAKHFAEVLKIIPEDQWSLFTPAFKQRLARILLSDGENFASMMDKLGVPSLILALFVMLNDYFADFCRSYNMKIFLSSFSATQWRTCDANFKKTVVEKVIINCNVLYTWFLKALPEDQWAPFIDAFKGHLENVIVIKSHPDKGYAHFLRITLENIPKDERMPFVVALKDYMPLFIQGNGLNDVAVKLPENQRLAFIEMFKDHLTEMRLIGLFEIVPKEQRLSFVTQCKDKLNNIPAPEQWLYGMLDLMPTDQRLSFIDILKDPVKSIVQHHQGLPFLLRSLTPEQRKLYVTDAKDYLVEYIESISVLNMMLDGFSKNKRWALINSWRERLGGMIKNILSDNSMEHACALSLLLKLLPEDKHPSLYAIFNQHLVVILGIGNELNKVVENCLLPFPMIENYIKMLAINNKLDDNQLIRLFKRLSDEKCIEYICDIFSLAATSEQVKNRLDIFYKLREQFAEPLKTNLRRGVLTEVCKSEDIDKLEAVYGHPFFEELKRYENASKRLLNTVSNQFFGRSVIETYSQEQIRLRIEQLKEAKLREVIGAGNRH